MEDPGAGSPYSHLGKRSSPQAKNCFAATSEAAESKGENEKRGRSDSETLSDDPLVESNDEGIGTDQLDEKVDDGELKEAKEVEVFVISDADVAKGFPGLSLEETKERLLPPSMSNSKNSLQLPSIVVQCESGSEKHLSPMSSRSESPLSDRTSGIDRFSSKFYGQHKDLLPFTDSDGLYDFPSSDKVNIASLGHQHKKSSTRKREKKAVRNCKTPSPTKSVTVNSLCYNLDVPIKEPFYKIASPRKPSPKRRMRPQVVSSSSSSESIVSTKEQQSSVGQLPVQANNKKSPDASEEESGDVSFTLRLPVWVISITFVRYV